jgi:hypothetical protein
MPAISYEHDFDLYEKAIGALEGWFQSRPPSVLVVSPEQLRKLAEEGAIPEPQLEGFVKDGVLDPSLRNGRERTAS